MTPEADIAAARALLEADPDHRVLRRLPPPATWPLPAPSGPTRRALFVDCETTGLDPEVDEVIELALLPFDYDASSGAIVSVDTDGGFEGLRRPGIPIPEASTQIHGITDADVVGETIDASAVERIIAASDLIVAHNAAFDRPLVEKHWPAFALKPWACSLADVDWRAEGFGASSLEALLLTSGWFYDGHRAMSDALAGVKLLSLELPVSRRPAMAALLECARRQTFAVRAEGSPFDRKDLLKRRGYRWDPGGDGRDKAWWILTADPDAEIAWLRAEIYERDVVPPTFPVSPDARFTDRIWTRSPVAAAT